MRDRRGVNVISVAVALLGLGCGPSQECRDYVACQRSYDPTVSVTAYEEGGSCWVGMQTASACTQQCIAALDALGQVPAPPAACLQGS